MFADKVKSVFLGIGEGRKMVLATSLNDRVTARTMSFVIINQKFYFQTDKCFLKYTQISGNYNVAICYKNVQIEGVCKELGHPFEQQNKEVIDVFSNHFENSYKSYSHLENERLFEVMPTLISVWDYDDGEAYQEFYNFQKETYEKSFYQCER